jgi:hypothetical protein
LFERFIGPTPLSGSSDVHGSIASLPPTTWCRTCRADITTYLTNGGTVEHGQQVASHASPTDDEALYRTADTISLDEIERIVTWRRVAFPQWQLTSDCDATMGFEAARTRVSGAAYAFRSHEPFSNGGSI